MTGQPSENEKRRLSQIIPDDPGTVTFEVERTIIAWRDGTESIITAGAVDWKPNGTVRRERRSITVTSTEWAIAEHPDGSGA